MVRVLENNEGPVWSAVLNNDSSETPIIQRGLQTGRTYRASVWIHEDSPNASRLVVHLNGTDTSGSDVDSTIVIRRDASTAIKAGEWYQLNIDFNVPADYLSSGYSGGGQAYNAFRVYLDNPASSGGTAYFDDLMVHPLDAPISAKVFDERTQRLKASLNNNNFGSKFEHDAAGRILKAWVEVENDGFKLISEKRYNIARLND